MSDPVPLPSFTSVESVATFALGRAACCLLLYGGVGGNAGGGVPEREFVHLFANANEERSRHEQLLEHDIR